VSSNLASTKQTALSVIVCNLLVIATFIYRVVRRGQTDLKASDAVRARVEFTTIELSQAATLAAVLIAHVEILTLI